MTSVDSRVVQMEFEDSQFDQGIRRTIKSIEDLDQSLVLKNGTKGLESIQNAAKNFSVGNMVSGLKDAADSFANIGGFASSATYKLGDFSLKLNGIFNLAGKLKGTIFNLLKTGGFDRALNIEQATWKMGKLGMDVKATTEDINYAVSGTRFGFDEAANAAAQFGASGIKSGEDMKTALRGISGVAAMTNSEYTEIANIFTSIAGMGKVMSGELNRISIRGINATQALAKFYKINESEVKELATDGKISFHDFAKAMDEAFGEASTAANETFSGALANMKAAVKRIGAEVAAPYIDNARKVFVNVIPLINKVNDAFKMSSYGSYKPIQEMSEFVKKQLDENGKYISNHGRQYEKIGNQYMEYVDSVYVAYPSKAVKKGLENVNYWVDKNGQAYKKVTTRHGTVIRKMQEDSSSLFGVISRDMSNIQSIISEFLTGLAKGTGQLDAPIIKYAHSLSNLILSIRNVIISVINVLTPFGKALGKALEPIFGSDSILKFSSNLYYLSGLLVKATEKGSLFRKALKPIATTMGVTLSNALKVVTGLWSTFMKGIKHGFTFFQRFNPILTFFGAIFDMIDIQLINVEMSLRRFANAGSNIVSIFTTIGSVIQPALEKLTEPWKRLFGEFTAPLDKVLHGPIRQFREIMEPVFEVFRMMSVRNEGKSSGFLRIGQHILEFSKMVERASVSIAAFFKDGDITDRFVKMVEKLQGVSSKLAYGTFDQVLKIISKINPALRIFADIVQLIYSLTFNPFSESLEHAKGYLDLVMNDIKNGRPIIESFGKLLTLFGRIDWIGSVKRSLAGNQFFEKLKTDTKELRENLEKFKIIKVIFMPFKQLFGDIIHMIGSLIANLTSGMNPIEAIGKAFSGLGTELKFFVAAIIEAVKILGSGVFGGLNKLLGDPFGLGEKGSTEAVTKLGEAFTGTADKAAKLATPLETLKNFNMSSILEGFTRLGTTIANFIVSMVSGVSPLQAFADLLDGVKKTVFGFGEAVDQAKGAAGSSSIIDSIIGGSGQLSSAVKGLETVKGSTDKVKSSLDGVKASLNDPFGLISRYTEQSVKGLGQALLGTSQESQNAGNILEEVVKNLAGGYKKIEDTAITAGEKTEESTEGVSQAVSMLSSLLSGVVGVGITVFAVKTVKGFFDVAKGAKEAFSGITETVNAFKAIPDTLTGIKDAIEKNSKYTAILKVAASLLIVAGALKIIASIDPASLAIGIGAMAAMLGMLLGFFKLFEKINVKKIDKIARAMLSFGGSMALLSASVLVMSQLSWEDLVQGLASLIIFTTAMAGSIRLMGPSLKGAGRSLMSFAGALALMTVNLVVLSAIPYDIMVRGLMRLAFMLVEVAAFMGLLALMKVNKIEITLKRLGRTLIQMASAVAILGEIEGEKIEQGLKAMGAMLLELAVFMALMKVIQNIGVGGLPQMSAGILMLSVAMIGLAAALKIISTIPSAQLQEVMLAFAGLMAILVVAVGALSFIGKGFLVFAAALGIVGIAMMAIGASFFILGAGITAFIATISSVAGQIDSIIVPLLKLAAVGAAMIIGGAGFLVLGVALIAMGAGAILAGAGILLLVGAMSLFAAIDMNALLENLNSLIQGLQNMAPKAGDAAGDTVESMATNISKRSGTLGASASTAIGNFIGGLQQGLPLVVQNGIALILGLLNGLSVGLSQNSDIVVQTVQNLVLTIGSCLVQLGESLLSFGRDMIGKMIEGMLGAIGIEIPDSVKQMVTGFTDGIGGALNDLLGIGKEAGDTVNAGLAGAAEGAKDAASELGKGAEQGISDSGEGAKTAANDLGLGIDTSLSDALSGGDAQGAVEGFMSNISASVGDGKDDILGQFEGFGPEISNSLGSGIDGISMTSGITTAIGGAVVKGKKKAEDAKDIGKQASKSAGKGASDNASLAKPGGSDIGKGLVSGIESWLGPAGSAGHRLGAEALRRAKAAVESKSPSKKFMKLGRDMGKGLVIGIDKMQKAVGQSGEELAEKAAKSTTAVIKTMSFDLGDFDTSPTIRPVVDLSGIEAGVNAANSIFANQSALQASMSLGGSKFYDPTGASRVASTKQVNNTISINLDYNAGTDANQIVRDIAAGLMNQAFMEA